MSGYETIYFLITAKVHATAENREGYDSKVTLDTLYTNLNTGETVYSLTVPSINGSGKQLYLGMTKVCQNLIDAGFYSFTTEVTVKKQ
jgi:hypothetical protein